MLIAGFQKTSFVDYPGKIAAVVFTPYCTMRCTYCHNRHILGKEAQLLDEQAVLEYLEKRRDMLDAVVISGGEPTLQKNLPQFISLVKSMGFMIKLDTNGSNPKLLSQLIAEGMLDYIAMDIKAPFEKYSIIIFKALRMSRSVNDSGIFSVLVRWCTLHLAKFCE